jgi:xanthine dehydrogenase YagR molybdenum-binding subunit
MGTDIMAPPPGTGAEARTIALTVRGTDADLGLVRVRRMTGVFAPGRVLDPTTARSQLMGGMLWGMSQALLEGNRMDTRLGRWAGVSLGVKGVGEIGQVGSAAAIANAVHHATGHRVRELPITVEHLLPHLPVPAAARSGTGRPAPPGTGRPAPPGTG